MSTEAWAVYSTAIHHVQRAYARREHAVAYCADLNRTSRKPEWVVVNMDVIAETLAEEALAEAACVTAKVKEMTAQLHGDWMVRARIRCQTLHLGIVIPLPPCDECKGVEAAADRGTPPLPPSEPTEQHPDTARLDGLEERLRTGGAIAYHMMGMKPGMTLRESLDTAMTITGTS